MKHNYIKLFFIVFSFTTFVSSALSFDIGNVSTSVGNIYKSYNITLKTPYQKPNYFTLKTYTVVPQKLYQDYRNSIDQAIKQEGSVAGYCEKSHLGKANFFHYGISLKVINDKGSLVFQIGKRGLKHDKDKILSSVYIRDVAYAWTMFSFGYGYFGTNTNENPYDRKSLVIGESDKYRIHAIQHFEKYSKAMNFAFGDVDDQFISQTGNFSDFRKPSFFVEDKTSGQFYTDCSIYAGNTSSYQLNDND